MWVQRGGKIGFHALRPGEWLAWLAQAKNAGWRWPVVKLVDDLDALATVKLIDANIVTVGRLTSAIEGLPGVELPGANLADYANALMGLIETKIQANPALRQAVDFWEVCNEPDPPGDAGYAALGRALLLCLDRAEALGLRLALPALNAGTPEWSEYKALVGTGLFGRMRTGGHIVTMHEAQFVQPDLHGERTPIDYGVGWEIPGMTAAEWASVSAWGVVGGYTLRYRYLYYLLAQRNEVCPLVISEMMYEQAGYTDAADTRERAAWYDQQLSSDYYALAALPFTVAPTDRWVNQNYEFAYGELAMHMADVRNRPNATESGSPPPPAPVAQLVAEHWFDPAMDGSEWHNIIPEQQIQNGWDVWQKTGPNELGDPTYPWGIFESIFRWDAWIPENERLEFLNPRGRCKKIFRYRGPFWDEETAPAVSLSAGTYRVSVQYADDCYVEKIGDVKVPPPDPLSFEARVGLGTLRGEWTPSRFRQNNILSAEFTVDAGDYRPMFGLRARWGIENPCAFVWRLWVERLTETPPPPPPPPATALEEHLIAEAATRRHFNSAAALQRMIDADRALRTLTLEERTNWGGHRWVFQEACDAGDTRRVLFYCREGDWGNIHRIEYPGANPIVPPPPPPPPVPVDPFEPWLDLQARGVDVSHWQDPAAMNAPQMRDEGGISFAFVKVSQIGEDDRWLAHYANLRSAGILLGPYHFLDKSRSGHDQATFFWNVSQQRLWDLPHVLDVEDTSLPVNTLPDFLDTWRQLTAKKLLIYTSRGAWAQIAGSLQIDTERFPLWVANWTDSAEPVRPTPWSGWHFWQWRGGTPPLDGHVPGYDSVIDLNRFNGTLRQLRQYLAGAYTPPPATSRMDMLPYFLGYPGNPDYQVVIEYTWDGGGTHPMQVQRNPLVNEFDYVKGGGQYEALGWNGTHILRFEDTSEAADKYYIQTTNGVAGAAWCPRYWAVGERFARAPLVVHYWKDGCIERLRGISQSTLLFKAHHAQYTNRAGITIANVAELYSDVHQETYFLAKGRGPVGYGFPGGVSWVSEIHPSGRARLAKTIIPCLRRGL